MAINPNTDFTALTVLTASQQNRFPRGVVAYAQNITSDTSTTEEIEVTSTSFTAVANRYYRITYFEPQLLPTAGVFAVTRIRKTNLAGTGYSQGIVSSPAAGAINSSLTISAVTTFSAGSTVVVATLEGGFGNVVSATRGATYPAYILVEDIGPA